MKNKSRKNQSSSTKAVLRTIRFLTDPIMQARCEDVESITKVQPVVQKLLRVLSKLPLCIGIAANQIGVSQRVIAVRRNLLHLKKPKYPLHSVIVMINPTIIDHSDNVVIKKEGCISFPGRYVEVPRYKWVLVSYTDQKGIDHCAKYNGMVSRVIQHECDHLNGVCRVKQVYGEQKNEK